jgi:hypothetical protein
MQIALHMGVHCTDGDRLLKCLLRNTDKLGEQGILVPDPGSYRPVIRELIQVLKGDGGSEDVQQAVLDAVLEDDDPDRIVLSHDNFLGVPGRSVEDNRLYPALNLRAPLLRKLFANCDVEFFLAIRDPATFIPAAFERAQELRFEKFVEGSDPLSLKWSDTIARLRSLVPDAPVTVWCNEDSPLIWTDILRALSQHDQFTELDGRDDFANELMNRAGRIKMAAYLKAHPPKNHKQHRRIVDAFLEKFARTDAIEEVIDLPGWDAEYVDQLTANYEADMDIIRQLDGVTLIEP